MDLTQLMAIGCFILTIPPGIDAYVRLQDRFGGKAKPVPSSLRLLQAVLMPAGMLLLIVFGIWLLNHPIKPTVIERTVTVEKTTPCPPAKSGSATSRGQGSPAMSGSGNSVNYGQSSQPKR